MPLELISAKHDLALIDMVFTTILEYLSMQEENMEENQEEDKEQKHILKLNDANCQM